MIDNTMSRSGVCIMCNEKLEQILPDKLCNNCWVEATVELDEAGEP